MANSVWLGNAEDIAEVKTITVSGVWAAADTATITINNKDLTVTVGAAVTIEDVVDLLVAAFNGDALPNTDESTTFNGDDEPEFDEITAEKSGTTQVVLTHDTRGVPFTATVSEVTAGTGALAIASTTNATGKNFVDNADNWSNGAVPTNLDTVYVQDTDVSLLYGLTALTSVTADINVLQSFTGEIGLPRINENGYTEYRDTFLETATNTINIGRGDGVGSGRIKIDSGTTNSVVVTVYDTGAPAETDLGAFIWEGTGTTNTFKLLAGDVSISPFADVASAGGGTINVKDANVGIGLQVTVDNLNLEGAGVVTHLGAIAGSATFIIDGGGTLIFNGSSTLATLTINSGRVEWTDGGTITTLTVEGGGEFDATNRTTALTITNTTLRAGSALFDPNGDIIFSNPITVSGGRLGDVALITAVNPSIQVT